LLGLVLGLANRAAAQIAPEQVRDSIDRAVTYLKDRQRPDGTWAEWTGYSGGNSALATMALINGGVDPADPVVFRALNYIRTRAPMEKTYSVALQTMALCAAKQRGDQGQIQRRVDWLVKAMTPQGTWGYEQAAHRPDNSNSQFAILALHEAEQYSAAMDDNARTINIPPHVWRVALQSWKIGQNPNGSWGYGSQSEGYGSMTCAGIASVYICKSKIVDSSIAMNQLCCQPPSQDPAIEDGLRWLGSAFSVHENPGRREAWLLYYLYGLERAGRLTARRFIGNHDWYREGSEYLVANQDFRGCWSLNDGEAQQNFNTSFALLFLSKGRWPLLVGKAKFGGDNDWDYNPDGVANLTAHVGRRWQRDLSWQVVDLEVATPQDLQQLPVLFMSGRNPLRFENRDLMVAKLRNYVNQGGFIFAEVACEDRGFVDSFRKLMADVFPEPEQRLQVLDIEHPIWRVEEKVPFEFINGGHVEGINVSCRTSVVLTRQNLSCPWHYHTPAWRREFVRRGEPGEQFLAQQKTSLTVGLNVLAYATNRELKYKYESFDDRDEEVGNSGVDRGHLTLASISHPGGSDAAAGAFPAIRAAVAKALGMRVNLRDEALGLHQAEILNHPILLMHGRSNFSLSEAQREQLKQYCENGGVLVADAVCGNEAFARSFREEMKETFGQALEVVPPEHEMFTEVLGGYNISSVTRREPQRTADGTIQMIERKVPPMIEGIKIDDRWVVLLSPYDMSCALEKHSSVECRGYTHDDSVRIGVNLIVYALLQQGP
jgi:hypothetical protein